MYTVCTNYGEIWHRGLSLACQIWPRSGTG